MNPIKSFSWSPTDHMLLIVTENSKLYSFTLSKIYVFEIEIDMKKNLAFNKIDWSLDGKFFLLQDKNNFIIGNPLISNSEDKLEENEEEQEHDLEQESMDKNNNNYNYNNQSNNNENYNNYMEGDNEDNEEHYNNENKEENYNDNYQHHNNNNNNNNNYMMGKNNNAFDDPHAIQYEEHQYNEGNEDEENY